MLLEQPARLSEPQLPADAVEQRDPQPILELAQRLETGLGDRQRISRLTDAFQAGDLQGKTAQMAIADSFTHCLFGYEFA